MTTTKIRFTSAHDATMQGPAKRPNLADCKFIYGVQIDTNRACENFTGRVQVHIVLADGDRQVLLTLHPAAAAELAAVLGEAAATAATPATDPI